MVHLVEQVGLEGCLSHDIGNHFHRVLDPHWLGALEVVDEGGDGGISPLHCHSLGYIASERDGIGGIYTLVYKALQNLQD